MTSNESTENSHNNSKETDETMEQMHNSLKEATANHNPKAFTTAPKRGKRKHNKPKISKDIIQEVHNFSKDLGVDLNGLLSGEKRLTTIICPKKLREAYKQVCREEETSTCKDTRNYWLYRVIAHQSQSMHLGNNIFGKLGQTTVHIDAVNNLQYTQSRVRRRIKRNVVEVFSEVKAVTEQMAKPSLTCTVTVNKVVCGKPAYVKATYHASIGSGNYRDTQVVLCEACYHDRACGNPAYVNVVFLEAS